MKFLNDTCATLLSNDKNTENDSVMDDMSMSSPTSYDEPKTNTDMNKDNKQTKLWQQYMIQLTNAKNLRDTSLSNIED